MSRILARREALLEDADKLYRERFRDRIRELEGRYRKEECRRAVIRAFARAADMWDRESGRMAASLGICYLSSSVSMKTYEYRIVLLGEEFWLDEEAVETAWTPDGFFEDFEADMGIVLKKLKSRYPRLCRNEEEAVRCQCVEYCHAAVFELCRDMMEEIMESKELIKLKRTSHFFVFFGRYRGEGEIVYRSGPSSDSSMEDEIPHGRQAGAPGGR